MADERGLRSATQFVNGPSPERAATTRMRRQRSPDDLYNAIFPPQLRGGNNLAIFQIPSTYAFAFCPFFPGMGTDCATLAQRFGKIWLQHIGTASVRMSVHSDIVMVPLTIHAREGSSEPSSTPPSLTSAVETGSALIGYPFHISLKSEGSV
jgi:hypothetical protein